jgi:O-antigen/teichoic acid export membrane protein
MALSLRRNFSWAFSGNLFYAACQWGMLTALAKLGSPTMVGQFALGLAVTAPVILFFNLQLRGIQATDAKQDYLFGDYLALRLLTTFLALIVLAALVGVSNYERATVYVVLGVAAAKAVESVSDVFYGLMQQHERMDCIALSLAAGVYYTGTVVWGVVGMIVSWAGVLLLFDMPNGMRIGRSAGNTGHLPATADARLLVPRWQPRTLSRLARLALPLGGVMLLLSLNTNIPRYFIEHHLGSEQLGLFSAIAYLLVAGNTVVSALGQSASPRLARYFAQRDRRSFLVLLGRLLLIGLGLGMIGILAAWFFGREILTLLYTPQYAERSDIFLWVMVAATFSYLASFLGYGMTATRSFSPQLPLFALVTASTFVASLLLVPKEGLKGAVLATMASVLVQFLGSCWVNWRALSRLKERED